MTEMTKNPNQMNVMMMQNMMTMTKVMTQNQKMMEKFVSNTQRTNSDRKIQNCPIRKKSSSLEAWIREVELWNDTLEGNDVAKLKYLNFMENVRKSECDDLKKFVETYIVENPAVVKDNKDNIKIFLKMIKDNLGKSDLEKSTEA